MKYVTEELGVSQGTTTYTQVCATQRQYSVVKLLTKLQQHLSAHVPFSILEMDGLKPLEIDDVVNLQTSLQQSFPDVAHYPTPSPTPTSSSEAKQHFSQGPQYDWTSLTQAPSIWRWSTVGHIKCSLIGLLQTWVSMSSPRQDQLSKCWQLQARIQITQLNFDQEKITTTGRHVDSSLWQKVDVMRGGGMIWMWQIYDWCFKVSLGEDGTCFHLVILAELNLSTFYLVGRAEARAGVSGAGQYCDAVEFQTVLMGTWSEETVYRNEIRSGFERKECKAHGW